MYVSNHAYGDYGYYGKVQPSKDVGFDVEMLEPVYDLFNTTWIIRSNKTEKLKRDNFVEYNMEIRDKNYNLLYKKDLAGRFESNHLYECVEETLRDMSIGDKVRVFCKNKYFHSGSWLDDVPPNIDVIADITLLDINSHLRVDRKKTDL